MGVQQECVPKSVRRTRVKGGGGSLFGGGRRRHKPGTAGRLATNLFGEVHFEDQHHGRGESEPTESEGVAPVDSLGPGDTQ